MCWSHGATAGDPGKSGKTSTELAFQRYDQRLNLAKFLKSDTRPIGVIIVEAMHSVDSHARALKAQAEEQDYVDPELAERLAAAAQVVTTLGVTIQKLGLDSRKVQIQERDQKLIFAALQAIAADTRLALTSGQRQVFEAVLPEHLRELMAEAS